MTSACAPISYNEWARLSPHVRRLTQHNPGPFSGPGTNTFLIGRDPLWILDPGPVDEAHGERIVEEIGEATVLGVLVSHWHADHWPMAPRLARRYGVETLGFAAVNDWHPDRLVADREVLEDGGGPRLEAIHTPGHAEDHLCFLFAEESTLWSADHVMGWSTTVIAPPGGSLNEYMRSLDVLESLGYSIMHPAHGTAILEPYARIAELRDHRHQRTTETLEALDAGLERIPDMVDRIYVGLDPRLHKAAQWSLLAHLEALVEQGIVEVDGACYRRPEEAC